MISVLSDSEMFFCILLQLQFYVYIAGGTESTEQIIRCNDYNF